MPDDAKAHGRPLFHIHRRMGKPLHRGVFDTFAQAVDGFGTGAADCREVFIRQPEIIAFRPAGVRFRVRKHRMMIDHIWIGPTAVVKPGKRYSQLFLLLDHIKNATRGQRPLIDAVQRTQLSRGHGKVHTKNCLLRCSARLAVQQHYNEA